jgi:hypothetical protein
MRIKILPFSIVSLFFIFLLVNTSLKAQTMLNESFEGNFPPTDWRVETVGTGRSWEQVTGTFFSFSGNRCMIFEQFLNTLAKTWAFSKTVALTAGTNYRLSYWYGQNISGGYERLKVTIGSGATIAAQSTILHDYQNITNKEYVEGVDTFTVPSSGNYNIGFNCYSNENSKRLVLDSIVLMVNSDCGNISSVGSASGPVSICSGVPFTVNLNSTNAMDGLILQWQSSPAGTNNFTNIIGANDKVLNTNQTVAKDYRCVVTCVNGSISYISNTVSVVTNLCYCTPVTTCDNSYQLTNVKFGSINNSTTCINSGYGNYTANIAPATVYTGSTVPISLEVQSNGINYAAAWIDYNQDGVFESNEFTNLGYTDNGATIKALTLSSSVFISKQALPGNTRMRVRISPFGPLTATDACISLSTGEIEDYLVNIVFVPFCSGIPVGGKTVASSNIVCPSSLFTLTVDSSYVNIDLATDFSFEWQSSLDGNNWTDIPGANSLSLNISQKVPTFYRRKISCISGEFDYSKPLFIKMTPFIQCYCHLSPSSCSEPLFIGIDSVSVNNMQNPSTCGLNGYTDYTGTVAPADIQAGTFAKIFLKFNINNPLLPKFASVAIDFNHNGLYESNEVTNIGRAPATISTNLRIPFDAMNGITGMRIRVAWIDLTTISNTMCFNHYDSETEDYLVNISASPNPGPNFSFYVNPLATGNGDGLSWVNAFKRLDTAMIVALHSDTIRVSKGTYSPPSVAPFYFNIKDSMVLLGGFPDNGNPGDSYRDWGANQTILNGHGVNTIAAGASGFTLDGFILQDLYSSSSDGNALLISNGIQPKIKHCVFRNNQNISGGSGSAIRIKNSSPIISECFFINNYDSAGSAVLNELNGDAVFYNSIFYKNTSQISTAQNIQSKSTFINCDFVSNQTGVSKTVFAGDNSILTINNSIFFNNYKRVTSNQNVEYSLDSGEVSVSNSTVTISNSITQAYGITGINGNMVAVDPLFIDVTSPSGPDNVFYTSDDGLNLKGFSSALNSGSNSSIAGTNKDILNNARIFNDVVDIGPYEIQFLPTPISNTWVGNVNSNWENPLNWSLGIIPNQYTDVIISSGTILLNSNATIRSLSINPGANFSIGAGYHLIILH